MSSAQQLDEVLDHPEWIEAELAQRSMRQFVEDAWHVPEPKTPFVPSFHIDAICDHLEAALRGEIRNLLINIPPRCSKSLLVAVFWPVWAWTTRPEMRWLFSSYAQSLSTRDSLKCRRVIESPWYKTRWGHRYKITSDQNQKTRFENDATGYRLATSVGGSATGEGGDVVVVDDPHNVLEALSQTQREMALLWWDETMSSRLNDATTGVKVIVMQRLHEQDLSGHVLEQGGYEHLMIPMEFEVDRRCSTSIGFVDPRKHEGDLLCEKRFPPETVASLQTQLGAYATAGQLQQRPAPRGGGLFDVSLLRVRPGPPDPKQVSASFRYWDKAGSQDTGDYTAGVRVDRLVDGTFLVRDVVRGQWRALTRERIIKQTADLDGRRVKVRVEQEPGSGGKDSAEATVRNLAGYVVDVENPTGDKSARAEPFSIQVEAGNVEILRADWNSAFIEELRTFPVGKHDDQVDASAGAFNAVAGGRPPGDLGIT